MVYAKPVIRIVCIALWKIVSQERNEDANTSHVDWSHQITGYISSKITWYAKIAVHALIGSIKDHNCIQWYNIRMPFILIENTIGRLKSRLLQITDACSKHAWPIYYIFVYFLVGVWVCKEYHK